MNTCYHCGREIKDDEDVLMKDMNIGFLELSRERKPFHRECWEIHKRKERMRSLKTLGAAAILCLAIVLLYFLPLLL